MKILSLTKSRVLVPDLKAGFTVTLVTSACWESQDWVQLRVKGKIDRVLPYLDGCGSRKSVTKSESGWASTETIHELVKTIEKSMEQNTNWILVFDGTPTQISAETP